MRTEKEIKQRIYNLKAFKDMGISAIKAVQADVGIAALEWVLNE